MLALGRRGHRRSLLRFQRLPRLRLLRLHRARPLLRRDRREVLLRRHAALSIGHTDRRVQPAGRRRLLPGPERPHQSLRLRSIHDLLHVRDQPSLVHRRGYRADLRQHPALRRQMQVSVC
jgi:hypothetical protein